MEESENIVFRLSKSVWKERSTINKDKLKREEDDEIELFESESKVSDDSISPTLRRRSKSTKQSVFNPSGCNQCGTMTVCNKCVSRKERELQAIKAKYNALKASQAALKEEGNGPVGALSTEASPPLALSKKNNECVKSISPVNGENAVNKKKRSRVFNHPEVVPSSDEIIKNLNTVKSSFSHRLLQTDVHVKEGEMFLSAINSLTYENVVKHLMSLRLEYIQKLLRPVIQSLMTHTRNNAIFNRPVDPVALGLKDYFQKISEPMDLGTIKNRLLQGHYHTIQGCVDDVTLVFRNATEYNPQYNIVYQVAVFLNDLFNEDMKTVHEKVIKEEERKNTHSCDHCQGKSCSVCGEKCHKWEPPIIVCHGPCGQRIKRLGVYFVSTDGSMLFCQKCYTTSGPVISTDTPCAIRSPGPSGGTLFSQQTCTPTQTPRTPGTPKPLMKKDMLKRRFDEEIFEPWIECLTCHRRVHQVCALYNPFYEKASLETSLSPSASSGSITKQLLPSPRPNSADMTKMVTRKRGQHKKGTHLHLAESRSRSLSSSSLKEENTDDDDDADEDIPRSNLPRYQCAMCKLKAAINKSKRGKRGHSGSTSEGNRKTGNYKKARVEGAGPPCVSTFDFASASSVEPLERSHSEGGVVCKETDADVVVDKTEVHVGVVKTEILLRDDDCGVIINPDRVVSDDASPAHGIEASSGIGKSKMLDEGDSESCTVKMEVDEDISRDLMAQELVTIGMTPIECQSTEEFSPAVIETATTGELAEEQGPERLSPPSQQSVQMLRPPSPLPTITSPLADSSLSEHVGQEVEGKSSHSAPSASIDTRANGHANACADSGAHAGSSSTGWRASALPTTKLSDFIEAMVRNRLRHWSNTTSNSTGTNVNTCGTKGDANDADAGADSSSGDIESIIDSLTIRVVANASHSMDVPDIISDNLPTAEGNRVPPYFVYRQKCILLFQTIDGIDTCLFCLYVQEFDDSCPEPNKSRVYIAYLDSVEFFRPRHLRTQVYFEIIISYLKWAQTRGFKFGHIWACPPQRGDNFIFWCHPTQQRTPSRDRLTSWYNAMLSRAKTLGICSSVQNLWTCFFEGYGKRDEGLQRQASKNSYVGKQLTSVKTSKQPKKKSTTTAMSEKAKKGILDSASGDEMPTCPPVFEGDFWVTECSRVYRLVHTRTQGVRYDKDKALNQRKCREILKSLMTKPIAYCFNQPVDPVALNIPDYFAVIKTPMDFGTVRDKLRANSYRSMLEFARDVRLTCDNAMLYNPPLHVIHTLAKQLLEEFETMMVDMVSERVGEIYAASSGVDTWLVTYPVNSAMEKEEKKKRSKEQQRQRFKMAATGDGGTGDVCRVSAGSNDASASPTPDMISVTGSVCSSAGVSDGPNSDVVEISSSANKSANSASLMEIDTVGEEQVFNSVLVNNAADFSSENQLLTSASTNSLSPPLKASPSSFPPTDTRRVFFSSQEGVVYAPSSECALQVQQSILGRPRRFCDDVMSSDKRGGLTIEPRSDADLEGTVSSFEESSADKRSCLIASGDGYEQMSLSSNMSAVSGAGCSGAEGSDVLSCETSVVNLRCSEESVPSLPSSPSAPSIDRHSSTGCVREEDIGAPVSCYGGGGTSVETGHPQLHVQSAHLSSQAPPHAQPQSDILSTPSGTRVSGLSIDVAATRATPVHFRRGRSVTSSGRKNELNVNLPFDKPHLGVKGTQALMSELSKSVCRLKDDMYVLMFSDVDHSSRGEVGSGDGISEDCLQMLRGIVPDTSDPDPLIRSPFIESRQTFLEMCQFRHLQFDCLRRAKYSSSLLIYHLLFPNLQSTRPHCHECKTQIKDVRWHCDSCHVFPDYELCNACKYSSLRTPHVHEDSLTPVRVSYI